MKNHDNQIDNYFDNLHRYKIHEFLYKIEGIDYESIIALDISNKSNYKDVLRNKITQKLTLTRLDTVFFTNSEIYIKKFIHIDTKDGGERRACGLEQALLESYKEKYFSNTKSKEYIFNFFEFVVEDNLSFKKLTPYTFKQTFLVVFVNMVESIVIDSTDIQEAKNIKGFGLYLLREMFDDFLLYIAENILFHFSNQDKKAIEFLNNFSIHETIDADGVKHKANPILDDSKHAWNMTTIRSTMLQYKHAKQDIYNRKNALLSIRDKLQKYDFELKKLKSKRQEIEKSLTNINLDLKTNQKNLDTIQQTTTKEIRYKDGNEEKIYEKKALIAKLFKKEDKLLDSKKILQHELKDIDIKISNKQKDIDIWIKKFNDSEATLNLISQKGHPIDKQYTKIKEALAKTLAKR